ncbi:MAG: hypothetical protein ACOYB8_07050 [Eubacteriaceae bacterium]|jgi:hypothetical protein
MSNRPIEDTINPFGFLENAAVGFFTDAAAGFAGGIRDFAESCTNIVDSAVQTLDDLATSTAASIDEFMKTEPEIEEYDKEQMLQLLAELKADRETLIQEGSINEIPKQLLWDYIMPEDRILITDKNDGAAVLPMRVYENALKLGIYQPDQQFSVILDFNGQDLIIDRSESYQDFFDRTGWDYLDVIPLQEVMDRLEEAEGDDKEVQYACETNEEKPETDEPAANESETDKPVTDEKEEI